MFGGGTMRPCRQFVQLGGFPVFLMHGFLLWNRW
jgi:hypothetical protein